MNRRRPTASGGVGGGRSFAWPCPLAPRPPAAPSPNLPAPLAPDTTGSAPRRPRRWSAGVISIGVDDDIRGFNPYVASQWSPAGAAVAGLVLPGAFTPGATATIGVPTALLDRVAVTSTDPFTVTYELNQGAAWSDGTPIAAEDFTYLWRQMTTGTDVVSPAGYQLISEHPVRRRRQDRRRGVPHAVRRLAHAVLAAAAGPHPQGRAGRIRHRAAGRHPGRRRPLPDGRLRPGHRPDHAWSATTSTGPTETTTTSVVLRAGAPADLVESLQRGDVQAVYLRPGRARRPRRSTAWAPDVRRRTVSRCRPPPNWCSTSARTGSTATAAVRRCGRRRGSTPRRSDRARRREPGRGPPRHVAVRAARRGRRAGRGAGRDHR